VFFESGHIVTNAPSIRLDYTPGEAFPEEALSFLDEALDGGAEYFITALLEFQATGQRPQRITLRLFKIQPFEMLYEQSYLSSNPRSSREENENIKRIARALLPHLR
jgi:hypothetical protein